MITRRWISSCWVRTIKTLLLSSMYKNEIRIEGDDKRLLIVENSLFFIHKFTIFITKNFFHNCRVGWGNTWSLFIFNCVLFIPLLKYTKKMRFLIPGKNVERANQVMQCRRRLLTFVSSSRCSSLPSGPTRLLWKTSLSWVLTELA